MIQDLNNLWIGLCLAMTIFFILDLALLVTALWMMEIKVALHPKGKRRQTFLE